MITGNSIPRCVYVRIAMGDKYSQLSGLPLSQSAPVHTDVMDTDVSVRHKVVGHAAWSPGNLERAHARDLGTTGSIFFKLMNLPSIHSFFAPSLCSFPVLHLDMVLPSAHLSCSFIWTQLVFSFLYPPVAIFHNLLYLFQFCLGCKCCSH